MKRRILLCPHWRLTGGDWTGDSSEGSSDVRLETGLSAG